jgi:hypothetical protein
MAALMCVGIGSEESLAVTLSGVRSADGRAIVDSYETAKNLSRLLYPLFKIGAQAVNKDVGGVVSNAGDYLSTAQYVSKLADWEVAGRGFQQAAKSIGFLKAMNLVRPSQQVAFVGLLATEKILLQFGLVSKAQGLKCATALASLAVDTTALVLLTPTGIGAAFFAVSYAWTVVDAGYQCAKLFED